MVFINQVQIVRILTARKIELFLMKFKVCSSKVFSKFTLGLKFNYLV